MPRKETEETRALTLDKSASVSCGDGDDDGEEEGGILDGRLL